VHEVVDEQLRATVEQLAQRFPAVVGVELVLLVDPDPRQLAALSRQLVAAARQLLLLLEQLDALDEPLLACSHGVLRHCSRARSDTTR